MDRARLPQLDGGLFITDGGIKTTLVGGCCGTDHRHVTSICDAWLAEESVRA